MSMLPCSNNDSKKREQKPKQRRAARKGGAKSIGVVIAGILLLIMIGSALAQSSAGYLIAWRNMSSSPFSAQSASFVLTGSTGQSLAGQAMAQSASYSMQSGYWQAVPTLTPTATSTAMPTATPTSISTSTPTSAPTSVPTSTPTPSGQHSIYLPSVLN